MPRARALAHRTCRHRRLLTFSRHFVFSSSSSAFGALSQRNMAQQRVQLYQYDLTNGLAAKFGPALLGRPIEAIW